MATMVVVLVFAVLFLRLWFLQLVNGPSYRVQSENNRIHLQDIPPFRGMIFDRNGALLVDNRPSYDLFLIPEEISDQQKILGCLDSLIGIDREFVETKMKEASRRHPFKPLLIKKTLSRHELAVIETNLFNLPGAMIQVRPQRHYIYREFASHLIGYLGEISERQLKSGAYGDCRPGDLIGKYGVEARWQERLNGQRGGEQVEVDASGRKLRVMSRKPPTSGLNISLTIDKKLQILAEQGLKGKKGAIVALNPQSGEILALASSPAFDPNVFIGGIDRSEWTKMVSSKGYPLQNRAVSGQYPPGSVFKIVVSLAGLEEGIIDPEEELFCNGSYSMGTHTFRCWRKQGHGNVSFHRALVESCDVYFYKVGRRLGVDKIAQYATMCGLGKKTGFDIGNERSGLIPTSEWKLRTWGVPWQSGETVSMAIGQSFVLVTPLQMARLISAVFNGGYLYTPKVIRWVGKEDRQVYRLEPEKKEKMRVKPENLERIKQALVGVVQEARGTGTRARVRGYTVAGKTGTAQVINLEKEKSLDREGEVPDEFMDHAWFVAIAPAEDPSLALAILIENGGHGGSAAAPIARQMFAAYLGKG